MSLRTRILIIGGSLVVVIVLVAVLVVRSIKNKQSTISTPTSTVENTTKVIDSTNFNPNSFSSSTVVETATEVSTDPVAATKKSISQFAKVFVERYATYSSDNNFQNVRDVEAMVTKNLFSYLSSSATTTGKNQSFFGVTTKVITAEISAWSDTAASVQVQTMRSEQRGSASTQTQQTGTVKLVKQGDRWLVDGIYWDK